MAKTVPLNEAESVWVTTYFGGQQRGTCFDISVQLDGDRQATATFTLQQLAQVIHDRGTVKGLAKPEFDTPSIRTDA